MINRAFKYKNKDIFVKLFKTFVRPHLEYGNNIWHPYKKYQSIAVEQVQRRATKLLEECKNMSYAERLKYLNLMSLKGRRLRGDLIQVFKIMNGMVDLDVNYFFSFSPIESTRNSYEKIFIQHSSSNIRKYCFSNRVASTWNSLPSNYKSAQTINQFKNFKMEPKR